MPAFRYKDGDRPLDGFTIKHGLGRGGFGEVYYAVSDSGREVALKVVQNYEDVELRGIGHCMNLKSPHLVTIFDVKHNDRNEPFVIMEFVAGPSLRQLLDDAPQGLGATKAAFFLRELAKGLTYLHDNGVVHRDMKPHNVFFEDGYVKIGDYSLSKIISTSHRSGHTMTVGTVHYMAPEIGLGRYDSRVDIYALGIMLYEMIVGQPPFVGESMGEVIMKHVTADPDLSMVDEPFAATIRKALAKDPNDRFATAAEMIESVFGAAHVRNSVTAFNPMELSVVAEKVARKAVPAGGISSSGVPLSPAAMPTELYGRPSDSTGKDHASVIEAEALDEASETELAGDSILETRRSGRPIGQLVDKDPISRTRRFVLTLVCLLAAAVYITTFSGFERSLNNLQRLCVFFLPMLLLGAVISGANRKTRWTSTLSPLANRVAILLAGTAAASIAVILLVQHLPAWMIGVLPLFGVNWSKRVAPDRELRADFKLGLFCGAIALAVSWLVSADSVATIGIAVGAAFSAQMFSPFHRLPLGGRSRMAAKTEKTLNGDAPGEPQKKSASADPASPLAAFRMAEGGTSDPQVQTAGSDATGFDDGQESSVDAETSPHNQAAVLILNLIYLLFPVAGGLHRQAVGRVVSGVIWLLTGGLFFVGQIYDAVMIVTGQFTDSEGRVVAPSKKVKSIAVNHLSSLSASRRPLHLGAFALNAIGIAGVFLACALVLGNIVVTVISLFDRRMFEDIAKNLGSQSWPEITHQIAVIVATILVVNASICFMFARKRHNAKHVLRALAGPLLICAAFAITSFAVDLVQWPEAIAISVNGSPVQAVQQSFLKSEFLTFFGVAAITCLAGASILAWPLRKYPTRQSEENA